MCGRGVVGEGAAALVLAPAEQQQAQLRGDAAGEGRVDPGVGARVEAGQQHEQGEHHTWTHAHNSPLNDWQPK